MVLQLLSPICMREKSGIHSHSFLLLLLLFTRNIFPCLGRGVDRLSIKTFLPWLDLVCLLLTQVPYWYLPVLPLRWGGNAPGVDLMAPQIDLVPYHQDLWFARVVSQNVSQARATSLHVSVHIPEYSPICSRSSESKSDEQQPRCPFSEYHHTSRAKEAVEGWPARKFFLSLSY